MCKVALNKIISNLEYVWILELWVKNYFIFTKIYQQTYNKESSCLPLIPRLQGVVVSEALYMYDGKLGKRRCMVVMI